MRSVEEVFSVLQNASSGEFSYDDELGQYLCNFDVFLKLQLDRESRSGFDDPWVKKYPNKDGASMVPVDVIYGGNRISRLWFVAVDGGNHLIPMPKSRDTLSITEQQYHIGAIVNHMCAGGLDYDSALALGGIAVETSSIVT